MVRSASPIEGVSRTEAVLLEPAADRSNKSSVEEPLLEVPTTCKGWAKPDAMVVCPVRLADPAMPTFAKEAPPATEMLDAKDAVPECSEEPVTVKEDNVVWFSWHVPAVRLPHESWLATFMV